MASADDAAAAAALPRGGSVLRQVLTGSQRTKLDTGDDREFYGGCGIVCHNERLLRDAGGNVAEYNGEATVLGGTWAGM